MLVQLAMFFFWVHREIPKEDLLHGIEQDCRDGDAPKRNECVAVAVILGRKWFLCREKGE
jgi:hypothetical protein